MIEFLIRLAGSISGSSIAVIFKGGSWESRLGQMIVGVICGILTTPIIKGYIIKNLDNYIMYESVDLTLTSSCLGGLGGYTILKVFFSINFKDIIGQYLVGKGKTKWYLEEILCGI